MVLGSVAGIVEKGADITVDILSKGILIIKNLVTSIVPTYSWTYILVVLSFGLAVLLASSLEKTRTQDIKLTRQFSFISISTLFFFIILRILSGGAK